MSITLSLGIAVVCMVSVFGALAILWAVIKVFTFLMARRSNEKKQ